MYAERGKNVHCAHIFCMHYNNGRSDRRAKTTVFGWFRNVRWIKTRSSRFRIGGNLLLFLHNGHRKSAPGAVWIMQASQDAGNGRNISRNCDTVNVETLFFLPNLLVCSFSDLILAVWMVFSVHFRTIFFLYIFRWSSMCNVRWLNVLIFFLCNENTVYFMFYKLKLKLFSWVCPDNYAYFEYIKVEQELEKYDDE